MRKLKTSDIPAFCRCLKHLGIKDRVQEIAKNSDNMAQAWDKGFDLLWGVFDLATEADGEQHIYNFLSGPFEMTPAEVADLPIPVLFDDLKQLAKDNDLAGFFNFAAARIPKT